MPTRQNKKALKLRLQSSFKDNSKKLSVFYLPNHLFALLFAAGLGDG